MSDVALGQMNGAHALVGALALQGVRHLFGVPGHGAYPIYDALSDFPSVEPIIGRNEQGALFTADGYARVTQDVAVATTVPLAGVTNALTSLWEANNHGSRILYLLEYDPAHAPLLHPFVRHHRVAWTVHDIAPQVHDLIRRLRWSRPGVAVLEVPNGVLHSVASVDPTHGARHERGPDVDSDRLSRVADALNQAKRPIICAGGYAWDQSANTALTQIADRLGAPVFTDAMSRGAADDHHPLSLGFSWNPDGPGEQPLTSADVVLAIGPRSGMATGTRSDRGLA